MNPLSFRLDKTHFWFITWRSHNIKTSQRKSLLKKFQRREDLVGIFDLAVVERLCGGNRPLEVFRNW